MGLSDVQLSKPTRRELLCGSAAVLLATLTTRAGAHNDAGVVSPPLPPPDVPLTLHDGSTTSLRAVLAGKVTALQLMFTSCKATCPIQGTLFAKGAKQLGDAVKPAQWLSVSIDPKRDTPAVLRGWLERFGAHPRWRAAQPSAKELEALVGFLKSKKSGADPHTAQVYFFNGNGELVMRSVDFPPVPEMIRVMKSLAPRA